MFDVDPWGACRRNPVCPHGFFMLVIAILSGADALFGESVDVAA